MNSIVAVQFAGSRPNRRFDRTSPHARSMLSFSPLVLWQALAMRRIRFLGLVLVIGFAAFGAAAQSLTQRLETAVAGHPDFSGVILIAECGQPVFQRAQGQRSYKTGTAMTLDSIFELASITKQFTAMAVMLLKEGGKLAYDDPIDRHLPGLPYEGITIRHLLNHTAGLPRYEAMMDQHWDKTKVATNADIIAYLKQYKPARLSAPGEKYEYSNVGYVMLGSIIEKASGQDYATFLRQRIFTPLGLTDTDVRSPQDWDGIGRFAVGHVIDKDTGNFVRAVDLSEVTYTVYLGGRVGPGRISSTAADLLKWDRALYGEQLIKRTALADAYQPAKLNNGSLSNYGFGWGISNRDPALGRRVAHGGGNPGYTNRIVRFLDLEITVIILSNNAYKDSRALAEGLEAALRAAQQP